MAVVGDAISGPRLIQCVFWIWLHLLQFDVSNQTIHPEEDEQNKRDRPLPSKRLTLKQALVFRWLLIPMCWILSALYSRETVLASIALVALTVIYDELGAHGAHWLIRNVVNAGGFASFEAGSALVLSSNHSHLDKVEILAICISAGIFATTIQAQDFKDVVGDGAIHRKTIPLVFPQIARYTIIIPLLMWSFALPLIWELSVSIGTTFIILAWFVGMRYLIYKTVPADQVSFYWYNVWLTMAHSLPSYYRLYVENKLETWKA